MPISPSVGQTAWVHSWYGEKRPRKLISIEKVTTLQVAGGTWERMMLVQIRWVVSSSANLTGDMLTITVGAIHIGIYMQTPCGKCTWLIAFYWGCKIKRFIDEIIIELKWTVVQHL